MNPPSILIIDANPIIRTAIRFALQDEGYTVVEAEDGRSALERMAESRPDLVLQDLLLPDMDGCELARRLRTLPAGAEIPILATSAAPPLLERARRSPARFTDYLRKPLAPSQLRTVIRAYLRKIETLPEPPGRGRRVLVADDDPIQLEVLKVHLERSGFQVTTAVGGAEALDHVRDFPPDAIVSDVLMPRLDGFRLCQAVRQDPRLADIPIVLISAAYTEEADGRLSLRAQLGYSGAVEGGLPTFFGHADWLGAVVAGGEVVVVPSPGLPEDRAREVLDRAGARLMLLTPLVSDQERLGVLVVASADRQLAGHSIAFARALGSQIGQAIAQVRTIVDLRASERREEHLVTALGQERNLVRMLAESFLGKVPQLPGLQVDCLYRPAAKQVGLGGDYFDFIPLDRQRIGVVIGDVCGKGLPAAICTATAKHMLRAYAREEADPERVLSRLNDALCHELDEETGFVTLFYGVLDMEAGSLTYANAGHPAPVLYDPASQSCTHLHAAGGIVGAFPDQQYQQQMIPFGPGSVLALFTDGVTEAAGALAPPEGEDVSPILRAHAAETVEAIATAILQRACEQAGGSLRDDVAIVVLRRS